MVINKKKVSLIMAKKNMSQKDLANKSGIGRGNISNLLGGKSCLPRTVFRIATALGVEIEEILEDEQ